MDHSPITPVSDTSPATPQRMSALYQYHNAPEVAPAHGLEFDDTIYPTSDKYPVIRQQYTHSYEGKHAFETDNRPPRIIFGMKVRTFLMVAAVMVCVVVGAAVGGAVGGQNLHGGNSDGMNTTMSNTTTSTSSTTSTFSAPTPTYTPLSDCPASNNTTYTSSYAKTSSASSDLIFTKYCSLASPLNSTTTSSSRTIAEAFVYSFSDCIEVCASYNVINSNSNCSVAVYEPSASRPSNCWVGEAGEVSAGQLEKESGTDIALLVSSAAAASSS